MVNPVQFNPAGPVAEPLAPRSNSAFSGTPFSSVLEQASVKTGSVRFSAHALQRLQERRITLSPTDQARIERAVDEAAKRDSRESLLLLDRLALIVSVPNRTVITAVPQDEAGDTVFTNIDSAVVVSDRAPLPPLT